MTIKFVANDAIAYVKTEGGKLVKSDKGRVTVELPTPWVQVSGTWIHPNKNGISIVTASGIPLVIDLGPAEAGWVLMAASNGLRQSIADAASAYKLPAEKTAKIIERANLLSPGKTENWGKPERAAPLADPLRAAILAILTGKISRFGADAPKFKGTTSEMLAIFREFGETKLGKPLGEPEWAEIERKIREEAAAILTAAGDQDDIFN